MTTLLIAGILPPPQAPQEPEKVKSTVTTADTESPAVAPVAPDWNALLADSTGDGGLTPASLASYVKPSVPVTPEPTNTIGGAIQSQVNDGQATKGTAAAREASGVWGRGTMKVVQGIEPAIVDGQQLGASYFAVSDDGPAVGSDAYMTATQSADPSVQATGVVNARKAASNPGSVLAYDALLTALTGATK